MLVAVRGNSIEQSRVVSLPQGMTKRALFKFSKTNSEILRLVEMFCARFPFPRRNLEGLPSVRGKDASDQTLRRCWQSSGQGVHDGLSELNERDDLGLAETGSKSFDSGNQWVSRLQRPERIADVPRLAHNASCSVHVGRRQGSHAPALYLLHGQFA